MNNFGFSKNKNLFKHNLIVLWSNLKWHKVGFALANLAGCLFYRKYRSVSEVQGEGIRAGIYKAKVKNSLVGFRGEGVMCVCGEGRFVC